jgi:hypothetical protein
MMLRLIAAIAVATLAPNAQAQAQEQAPTAAEVVLTIPLNITYLHPDVQSALVWCSLQVPGRAQAYSGRSQQMLPSNRAFTQTATVTISAVAKPGDTVTYSCELVGSALNTTLVEVKPFSTTPLAPQLFLSPTPQASGSFVW